MGHAVFRGSAKQMAEEMADWFTCKACDGFNVQMPVLPRCLKDFVGHVVPELQRMGRFRMLYTGGTLRQNMGPPTPARRVAGQVRAIVPSQWNSVLVQGGVSFPEVLRIAPVREVKWHKNAPVSAFK